MFPSLLRARQQPPGKIRVEEQRSSPRASMSPGMGAGPAGRRYSDRRYATADFTELDDDDESIEGIGRYGEEEAIDDEDGPRQSAPMLPLFSASFMGTYLS